MTHLEISIASADSDLALSLANAERMQGRLARMVERSLLDLAEARKMTAAGKTIYRMNLDDIVDLASRLQVLVDDAWWHSRTLVERPLVSVRTTCSGWVRGLRWKTPCPSVQEDAHVK